MRFDNFSEPNNSDAIGFWTRIGMRLSASGLRLLHIFFGLVVFTGTADASDRVFYIQAIEHKGKTHVKKEPFPLMPLVNQAGMKMKPTDGDGVWAVEAYGFSPAQITVMQGDDVTLHFIGINGAHHGITIEGVKTFELTRGTMRSVTFKADKPGLINFICADHAPNMTGQIVVLAK